MSKPLTIIFCGTPSFALPSLEAVATDPAFKVLLVVTQPDRPHGRKQTITPPPVKMRAEELRIPVFQPQNINEELPQYLKENGVPRPDFLVVVAYGKILQQAILDLPMIEPINVHASLLPRWRGASPIEHAILAGDSETGVTIQIMAPALDAGAILAQVRLPIGERDTTLLLKEKLSRLGADLLASTLQKPLHPRAQSSDGITVCRKLSREDGVSDPKTMAAEDIDRAVRALNPWPGVTCEVQGRSVKLLETSLKPTDGSLPLPCAHDSTLHIVHVQEPGKKAMRADAWKRGMAALVVLLFALLPTRSLLAETPEIEDTDGDAIIDKVEDANHNGIVDTGETDWLNADTDNGGEADGQEIHGGRNPFVKEDDLTYDRDHDGLSNGREIVLGTDPKNPDTDGDGSLDGDDPFPLEREYKSDNNKNGLPDEWEQKYQLSPGASSASSAGSTSSSVTTAPSSTPTTATQTPAAAAAVATKDPDGDKLTNEEEFKHGTNPIKADTDRDGIPDGEEVKKGTNPEESPCLAYDPDVAPLPDIIGHWSEHVVTSLQRVRILPDHDPVIRGYRMGTGAVFLPNRAVSRFEFLKMAVFSSCIHLIGALEAKTPFPDVPALRPHEDDDRVHRRRVIASAVAEEIVQGYGDGLFHPDDAVTRAEALKMLLKATRLTPLPEEMEPLTFTDIPENAWFTRYIEDAYALRLIEGYEDNTFRPNAAITRSEAAKIIQYALITNPGVNGYVIPEEDQ